MRHAVGVGVLSGLLAVAVLSSVGWAQDAAPPRVRLVATGGTISNAAGGRLTADELIDLIESD